VLEFLPARPHDVRTIVLDISRLRTFIEYTPLELPDGLRLTWPGSVADLTISDTEPGTGHSAETVGPEHGTAAP
jgi:hypothetical protein